MVLGKPITSADVFNRAKVNATPDAFKAALAGGELTSIERDGKELFFAASTGAVFAVHLMLNGKFTVMPWIDTHKINAKIISVGFDDGQALVVSDYSGMACVTLNPVHTGVPDAMSPAFTFEYFQGIAQKKKTANIKALLIDQKVVRGIGNAYVDEILYDAGISPHSVTGKIPHEYLFVLYEAIRRVLEDAIEQITRISPDIISGEERSFLRVHTPKKATTAVGESIIVEEVAKKRTYYTARQKLFI